MYAVSMRIFAYVIYYNYSEVLSEYAKISAGSEKKSELLEFRIRILPLTTWSKEGGLGEMLKFVTISSIKVTP